MFGKKQDITRELEEKLNNAQQQLEAAQAEISQMKKLTGQIVPYFQSRAMVQDKLDEGLPNVMERARVTIAAVSRSKEALEQLVMEVTSLRGQLEDDERDKTKLREMARRQKEQMDAVAEESRQTQEPVKAIRQIQDDCAGDIKKLRAGLEQMLDYAKQMTVSSLNCAIEAGRMGDAGRKFIVAAEEVRLLSSAYERMAQAASGQADSMENRMESLGEQAGRLEKSRKEQDAVIQRLTRNLTEQETVCDKASGRRPLEKAVAIADYLKEISQNHDKMDVLQNRTLDEIAQFVENFQEEQEARKELEQIAGDMLLFAGQEHGSIKERG